MYDGNLYCSSSCTDSITDRLIRTEGQPFFIQMKAMRSKLFVYESEGEDKQNHMFFVVDGALFAT